MGIHRFRLSDMIPNAWFYKLRAMTKTKKNQKPQSRQQPRSLKVPAADIDDIFPHLPTRSRSSSSSSSSSSQPRRRKARRRKTIYKPSPRRHIATNSLDHKTETCADNRDFLQVYESPDSDTNDQHLEYSASPGFSCSDADIIIDVKERCFVKSSSDNKLVDAFDTIPDDLPPIFTKNKRFNDVPDENDTNFSIISPELLEIVIRDSLSIENSEGESGSRAKITESKTMKTTPRKHASSPPGAGIKLRTNSPRICSKKTQVGLVRRIRSISRNQKHLKSNNKEVGLCESFAVVKASVDPEKDFRESMTEMILENNIRASKDLEHLLACYLTLNSNEYHELIIKAFEQIWFNVLAV